MRRIAFGMGTVVVLAACGDDRATVIGARLPVEGDNPGSPAYIVGSTLNGPEGWNAYVTALSVLEPQEVDYDRALEVPGRADVWVWDDKVFVGQAQSPVVSRYAVTEGLEFVEEG